MCGFRQVSSAGVLLALSLAVISIGCGGKAGVSKAGASKAEVPHGAVFSVSGARAFRAALGSNRVIELAPGVYNLSDWKSEEAEFEGGLSNLPKGVSWSEENGEGLTLTGIKHLTIRGAAEGNGGESHKLIVDPRNVNVLKFVHCSDIVIEGITAGHSEGGMCAGGVLAFEESSRITVNGASLYGSGTEGFNLKNVSDMKVTNTRIHDCTEAIFSISGGGKVVFENCTFVHNRGYHLVYVAGDGAQHVSIINCVFGENWNEDASGGMFFLTGKGISISRTKFIGNRINKINVGNDNVLFGPDCEFDGAFIDARDGMAYRLAKIGRRTWMTDNMNYRTDNSYCYNNSDYACVGYGRLYPWGAAKEACPAGWHLPSKEEWNDLVAASGGNAAGKVLKSSSGWDGNGAGTDNYGFSAPPGGSRAVDGEFKNHRNRGLWWTADEYDADSAYYRRMGGDYDHVYEGTFGKKNSFSVRCVQDAAGTLAAEPQKTGTLAADAKVPKTYKTVKIGGLTWMVENLNITPSGGNSWCYENRAENCAKYGRLYDWNTAKTACPAGWKLPDMADWKKLVTAVGGSEIAGKKLKSKNGWNDFCDCDCEDRTCFSGAGTDYFGFSALPGGYRYSAGNFDDAGDIGDWWTATENSDVNAYGWEMNSGNGEAYNGEYDKSRGHSIRCVKE